MKDHDAFWLFDQGGANRKSLKHRLASFERVDDEELTGPGLYLATCDCGWESGIRSQTLIDAELSAHLKESA